MNSVERSRSLQGSFHIFWTFELLKPEVESAFWTNVRQEPGDECWEWTSRVIKSGYGIFSVRYPGKQIKERRCYTITAHRASYFLTRKLFPIGINLCVCHLCDNKLCVRPSHLIAKSRIWNIKDYWDKRRDNVIGVVLQNVS